MLLRTLALSAIAATAAGASALPAQAPTPVAYSIAPVLSGGALSGLAVEIRFDGDADGETHLGLPGEWAGSDSLWRQVDGLTVEGATSVSEDGPEARKIRHRPGAPLVVRYRVASAWAGEPGFAYEKARPLILPGWFFFHGEGVFAAPDDRWDVPARFTWRGFPAGWTVASDLDHVNGRRGTVRDVVESVAIGAPDLRVVTRQVDGAPLRVAVRGAWDFTAEELAERVQAVIAAENRLWGDPARPFVVTLAPLGGSGPGLSYTGTARGSAFSVASTPGFPLAAAMRFLAHEYMHTWTPGQLGGHEAQDEVAGKWLSEGFTDFYAGRALVRAGLWTPEDFAAELNRTLLRNATSPVRGAVAAELAGRFWSDANVQQLPYDRGHLLAAVFDARIRRATGGRADLDDVLQAQRRRARQNASGGGQVDAATLFPQVVRAVAGLDLASDIARHNARGEPIVLPADLYPGCAGVRTLTQPEFHRGFDLRATEAAGGVVTGVDPASPAHAAGLRDGMKLVRREGGSTGDSAVEVAYRVEDAGVERVIRYLPQGRRTITFQRVVLDPGHSRETCVKLMGGS